MAPSDIKRFTDFLKELNPGNVSKASARSQVPSVSNVDFEAVLSLLDHFKEDARVQRVLMDPGDDTIQQAVEDVDHQLRDVELQSIAAYIHEAEQLSALHGQIRNCDEMLGKVEGRLGHFDDELSTVNNEIRTLEEESDRLGAMLRNRSLAAESLGRWLEDTTVPPELIADVQQGNPAHAQAYTSTLSDLRVKIKNMQAFVDHENLQAYPTMKGLEVTAAEKVKAFLLDKINSIKPGSSAGTSNATIRRQGLLAYKEYTAFLRDFAPAAYRAVVHRYAEDNKAHLSATVRTYMAGLAAATAKRDKAALVTPQELAQSGLNTRLTSMMASAFTGGAAHDDNQKDFELGSRMEDLLHPDFSVWPSAAAKRGEAAGETAPRRVYKPLALQLVGKSKLPQEYTFKALLHQMCDAAVGEFVFLEVFFGRDAAAVFDECWRPVLAMVHNEVDVQLSQCYDVIGILVMIRIVSHCHLQMTHAQVPALDAFLDKVGIMLWPHFSRLIREHIDAVTNDKANAKAKALKPSQPAVLAPVKRWTQLFISIGKLNAEYNDSQVNNNLVEMAKALHSLLYQIRLLFPNGREGEVFHIINLQHIAANCHAANESPMRTLLSSAMLPSNTGGLSADALDMCRMFDDNLDLCKSQYKIECLSSHVKDMYVYVSKADKLVKLGKTAEEMAEALGENKARKVMHEFKDRWKQMVNVIRQEVHQSFAASAQCQHEMTRACLEGLYGKYKDFLAALGAQGPALQAVAREGPSLQTVAYELRDLVG